MTKLKNFLDNLTTRYSFYSVILLEALILGSNFLLFCICMLLIGITGHNLYLESAISQVFYLITCCLTLTIYGLFLTIKFIRKEQSNPQFRISNPLCTNTYIQIISIILFIGSIISLYGYFYITIRVLDPMMLNDLFYTYYLPVVLFIIGFYIFQLKISHIPKGHWCNIIFFILETIICTSIMYLFYKYFIMEQEIPILYIGLPHIILIYILDNYINNFLDKP